MVYPCVEILDGDKLLRRYAVEFDDDWVYKESHNAAGRLGNLSEGSFSSAVINTGNPAVTEYDFNEDGIFLNRGAAFKINVEIKEASADNKYAVIRSTEAKMSASVMWTETLRIVLQIIKKLPVSLILPLI